MKKSLLTLGIILASYCTSFAQQIGSSPIYYNGSNVGIGTASPTSKLNVIGDIIASGTTGTKVQIMGNGSNSVALGSNLYLGNVNTTGAAIIQLNASQGLDFWNYNLGTGTWQQHMTVNDIGNVGIGTTSPTAKLDVNGVINSNDDITSTNGTVKSFLSVSNSYGTGVIGTQTNHDLAFYTNSLPVARFTTNGNFGIGTATPVGAYLLTLAGSGNSNTPAGAIALKQGSNTGFFLGYGSSSNNNDVEIFNANNGYLRFATNNSERIRIQSDGNVGIGTTNPDEKLTVKGNIHAAEVKVEAIGSIPDYVFEPEYKLTSLEELKTYVDKNHHLPNIPSAKEIEKDGIQLGGMSMNLLKTIEELSLHVIELNNQLKLQKEEMENLKKELHNQPKL